MKSYLSPNPRTEMQQSMAMRSDNEDRGMFMAVHKRRKKKKKKVKKNK